MNGYIDIILSIYYTRKEIKMSSSDFSQTKLTKSEWESIEKPVLDEEKQVLRLIQDGYNNINIKVNENHSILSFMKIEYTAEIEAYLYNKYFIHHIHIIYYK